MKKSFLLFLTIMSSFVFAAEFDYIKYKEKYNLGFDTSITRFVSAHDRSVLDAYNTCGDNDGNSIGTFNPKNFNAKKILTSIQKSDLAQLCRYRQYSNSREDAIKKYKQFTSTASSDPFSKDAIQCLKQEIPAWDQESFKKILEDKSNIGVFASLYNYDHDDNHYPEGCAFYEFFIYRASGTVLRFVFNYTD